jgi:mannose/fructose/N-acetylgalactosamine-specific phosphotransferase system component IIC
MSLIWAAVAGMIVYLDTTAVAQIMISQPIIACPLWGWMAGRWEIGILFGIIFQLLWSGSLPVGAARFPEGNVGALVATALAVRTAGNGSELPWLALTLAIAAGVATAYAGTEATVRVRRILTHIAPRLTTAAERGDAARFRFWFCGALGVHAAAGLLLSAAGLAAGIGLLRLANTVETELFSGIAPVMLGIGAAVIVSRFVKHAQIGWFLAALAVGLGGGWLWL